MWPKLPRLDGIIPFYVLAFKEDGCITEILAYDRESTRKAESNSLSMSDYYYNINYYLKL